MDAEQEPESENATTLRFFFYTFSLKYSTEIQF